MSMPRIITLRGVKPQPSGRSRYSVNQGFSDIIGSPCEEVMPSPPQKLLDLFDWDSEPERNSQDSGFFKVLPPELRNKIYQYVLGDMTVSFEERETQCDHCGDPEQHPNAYRCVARVVSGGFELNLSMLRVCRQIYNEARLLPFGANQFKIPCKFVEPFDFMRDLVPEQSRAITNLDVEDLTLHSLDEDEAFNGTLPSPERLRLDLWLDWSTTRNEKSPAALFVDLENIFVSSSVGLLASSRLKHLELTLELHVLESDMTFFEENMDEMCAWLEKKKTSMLPP